MNRFYRDDVDENELNEGLIYDSEKDRCMYIEADGNPAKGWKTIDGDTYYFIWGKGKDQGELKESGKLYFGWKDRFAYINPENNAFKDCIINLDILDKKM